MICRHAVENPRRRRRHPGIVLQPDVRARPSRPHRRARGQRVTELSRVLPFQARTTSATVEQRDVLARTATGKLQKFKLRALYWEGFERGSAGTSVQGLGLGSWCQLVPFHFSITEPWVPSPIAQA